MKQFLMLFTFTLTLSGCATVSDLPPGYTLGAQDAEGLAVVSLTLSGKDLDRISTFEYRVREAAGNATEEVKRTPYFDSARQHARWLQDKARSYIIRSAQRQKASLPLSSATHSAA